MHPHNFFSVKINSLQSTICFLRLDSQWSYKDTAKTYCSKNAYKGWFSETKKILTLIEKDEHEITLYEAMAYRHRINAHLGKISNKNTVMHQHKCQVLTRISKDLTLIIDKKKTELKDVLELLQHSVTINEDLFSKKDIEKFEQLNRNITQLFKKDEAKKPGHFNKLKLCIEYFISFIRKKIAPLIPDQKTEIETSVNKLLYILEEKLQADCINLLNEIKHMIMRSHTNKLFLSFIEKHKILINISPANPTSSHKMYLLLKSFLEDLQNHCQQDLPLVSRQIYIKSYKILLKKYNNILKNNYYYINNKNFSDNNRYTAPIEIKHAQAPVREGNEIRHFLNSYDNIRLPSDKLQGAFPALIRNIKNAKHVICITGWELDLHLDFLQPTLENKEKHERSNATLGKILVQKAIDNPQLVIAIKVWAQFFDNKMVYHHDSITYLNTIAKEKGLKNGLKDLPNLQFRAVNHTRNFNTHHAKSVIVDAEFEQQDGSLKRKLTAFYGGLDLSRDRMDDFNHSFHRAPNTYGWRDIHQQAIGPVVVDVLADFFSSWQNSNNGRLKFWNKWTKDDRGYNCLERFCSNLRNTQLLNYSRLKQPAALWQSQFLRSTMSVSHSSFWPAAKPYEKSIAIGYKNAIEEAQHSIELETQYLIGGPGIHDNPQHAKFNPIPEALVNKIVERHEAGKPFHAFITLPMLPNTNSAPGKLEMDSIRALQWLTIKWIMSSIEQHTNTPWWHFISFNFLAQWHGKTAQYEPLSSRIDVARNELIAEAQRSPIYVHSKSLTVDNKIMICGSANANERSMRGRGGDSEIAIFNQPTEGCEWACENQIIEQRNKSFRANLGNEFVTQYPECVKHPELYAHHIREQALCNLSHFHVNKQSMAKTPGASPLMTWPFLLSHEPGHVGEYKPEFPNLIDTPRGKENEDCYQWHPNNFSGALRLLAAVDIRITY